jgi:tetratricopeptide (TPR) repeat protein
MNALGVDVSSRNADDPRAICRETGANRLLRGSLQRSGETLRVTWTIVDATGVQVAGDTVEGKYDEIFEIQDSLAEQVLSLFGDAVPADRAQSPPGEFAQDRYLEAVGHLVRNDNPASVDAAIEILSGLGDSPRVLATLARAYVAKRLITDDPKYGTLAMELCQRVLTSGERTAETYTTLGEINALVGKHQEAIDGFRAALSLQPDHEAAMIGLARALAESGKDHEAEMLYKQTIALRPNLWITHNHLGVFLLVRGRHSEAEKSFLAASALTPDNVKVLNNLGATYQQMGRHEQALKTYARSLAERPNADAYSNQGTCLFFMGRFDESADAYERATALNPDSWLLWINLADAYRWSSTRTSKAADTYAHAIALCEKDLALRPRDSQMLAILGASYAKLGDKRRAVNLATLAIKIAPTDAYTLYAAGVAFEVAGNREKAIEALSQAFERGYSREEAHRDPELREVVSDARLTGRPASAQSPMK